MRIFLMAYARKNLGDDLFIKMILEKYLLNQMIVGMKIKEKQVIMIKKKLKEKFQEVLP